MNAPRRRALLLLLLLLASLAGAPSVFASTGTITVTHNPTFGNILTDGDGRTLYRFTRDTLNSSSACYNRCATVWPPLLVADGNPVAGEGLDGGLLGVLTRTDGTRQVMYNGMPLYYYQNDAAAGDTKGQYLNDAWFVVKPNTTTVGNQPVSLRAAQHATLGPMLTDGQGRALYLFTRDSANLSVCYERCATVWPPLLVGDVAVSLEGIGGALSIFRRNDGNRQVAYEGKPLYYYASDAAPGDTKGQGVGNVWYVVPPVAGAGAPAAPAAPAAPGAPAAAPVPAALPQTGNGDAAPLGALALIALLSVAGGAVVRLRWRGRRV
jgi:predicted lipoprotein with Yx(FWY)xxD motif